jgi:transcriptional regulator with XRE-family HTH domain
MVVVAVRLTNAQVREVREKFAEGARQADLAAEYGISQNTVSSLVLGRTRRPAGGPISPGTAQKLNVEEVRRIRHDLATGSSQVDLAHQYGVSQQMISHITTGRAFADVNGPLIGAKRAPAPPLTLVQVEDIRDRVHDDQARQTVADAFGVSLSTVNAVMTGRTTGRSAYEEPRLSRDQVKCIRNEFHNGTLQRELAERYGTEQQTISQIVRGRMYPSYGGPIAGARSRKLTRDQVEAIRRAFSASTTVTELSAQYDLDPRQVISVLTGATYATYPGSLVDPEAI